MNKSLKNNYIYNLLYQVLIMVLPLIITPYLSRVLGAEKIGIYSFTLSILSYFVLFGCMGINLYGQRQIAAVQDDKEKRTKIFLELFILKFIMIFLSFVVYAIFNFNNPLYGIYYKILTIELFANAFDITWFYQGVEEFKKITIRNTIVRLVSILLIFLLVKTQEDLIIYFLIYTISNFWGYIILWFNLKNFIVKINIKSINIIKQIGPAISFFIPQIAIQIYTVLDKTMIGVILKDMAEVGYYEQSQKIVKMILMLITSLGTVMVPRIANLYANHKDEELEDKMNKVFAIVSFSAFPVCFGIIGIATNFVPWFFGEGFLPIINLLYVFSFLIIAIGFNNITGIQYLISTNKQKIFTISVFIGAISNAILNSILIPILKGVGAAISTVIAEFIILIVQIVYLRKTFNFKKIYLTNLKYLIYSLIMFIPTYILGTFLTASAISTAIQIMVGGIIYIIILFITRDSILLEIIDFVKRCLERIKVR